MATIQGAKAVVKDGGREVIAYSQFEKPQPQSVITIYSMRRYGEPRLKKPKELTGIKQSFSVDWIDKKCKCPCYMLGDDIYIKHRDFNSIELYRTGHKFRKKFIYKDEFGCVVLRGEAWLMIKNIRQDIKNKVFLPRICVMLAEQVVGELGSMQWERFFEEIGRASCRERV